MTDTTKLPPLPEPDCDHYGGATGWQVVGTSFSKKKLIAYGAECRRMALEEAAQEFDRRDARNPGAGFYDPSEPAQIIRALKDKA